MKKNDMSEKITSLIDNELKDIKEIQEIENAIKEDPDLAIDFKIQKNIKDLVRERIGKVNAPVRLEKSIIAKTTGKKSHLIFNLKERLFDYLFIFKKPQFALPSLLTIIITLLIIFQPFSQLSIEELISQQTGESNMFVQANQNFKAILTGELGINFESSKPEEINKFFRESGVKYNTLVPEHSQWKLLGATVSIIKNEKCAHQIYKGENNKLLYLYQVDENYLNENNILELSDDLMDYLNSGEIFRCDEKDFCTYIWKCKKKIFALVSNDDASKIENIFIKPMM